MNYTKNYHLPQWVKDDRIMMDDFNRMCADMEAGLNRDRETAQEEDQALARSILRSAYNHYHLIKDMDPFPSQMGVFHQLAVKEAIPGTVNRDGARYMALETGTIGVRDFFKSFRTVSDLTMVKDSYFDGTKGIYEFSCPMAGVITALVFLCSFRNLASSEDIPFRLKVEDLDTGEQVWESTFERGYIDPHGVTYGNNYVQVNIPIHAGVRYRLSLETDRRDGDGTVVLQVNEEGTQASLYGGKSGCTVSHTFQDVSEESDDGLTIVRYKVWGPEGTVTLHWNGKTVQPVRTLETPEGDGEVMREAVYRLPERPMKGNTLSLSFQCQEGGEIWFYEWGAVLC